MFALLYNRTTSNEENPLSKILSQQSAVQTLNVAPADRPIGRGVCVRFQTRKDDSTFRAGVSYCCPVSGRLLLAWLRLDNRDELAARLDIAAQGVNDAQLLLAAYARWQDSCVEHLVGDFAFALYDPHCETVLLARDPIGVRPLYYRLDADLLAVSSAPAALLDLPEHSVTRDMDWAARFLLNISKSHSATAYHEINKLPPGHLYVISPGAVRMKPYFNWRDDAPAAKYCDRRWVEAYREQLQQAIACRLDAQQGIGCENSGGIDSAVITGFAAQHLGSERLHTFGYATQPLEAGYILATSQLHKIQHNHIFTDYAQLTDTEIDRVLDVLGYPAEHFNGPGHTPFYRLCQQLGLTSLLSGFGGDEVVTNPGYHLLDELIDQRDWRNLLQALPGNPVMRSLRLGKRLWRSRNPSKYNPVYIEFHGRNWPYQPLREDVVERLDLQGVYFAEAIYDAPYRRINDYALQYKLAASYVPTRLENCSLVAAMYGVEYSWPLLDVRLIQQYLSTPSIEKYGPNGMGRYLHRRAMDGLVPPMVQWKPSKDMGVESLFAAWRTPESLRDLAQQLLAELECVPAGLDDLLDTGKLKQTAQQLPQLQGETQQAAIRMLRRTTSNLQWLNRWLARPL